MLRRLYRPAIVVFTTLLIATISCGKQSIPRKTDSTEWKVEVNKVIEFNDSVLGIGTDFNYTVADTARVNKSLKKLPHCGNVSFGWTLPGADSSIRLVVYDKEPLISETVTVTEANRIPTIGEEIEVVFKFPDAKKWEAVTGDNVGNRLAVIVNGQLMNAPQINTEISSGSCSVIIPSSKILDFLPDFESK